MLIVGAAEHLGRMRDQCDQVGHLPLGLGHRGDQAWRTRGLGNRDMEPDIGAPIPLEFIDLGRHLGDQSVEPGEPLLAGPLGGKQRRAALDRDPIVEHGPGLALQRLALLVGQWRLLGRRTSRRRDHAAKPGDRSEPAWSAPGAASSARSATRRPAHARGAGGYPAPRGRAGSRCRGAPRSPRRCLAAAPV